MIDFFSKNTQNISTAKQLMKYIFNLEESQIVICYLDKIGEISISDDIKCLCLISFIEGDVGCLLQIYRIEIDFFLFLKKLKDASTLYKDEFFIPYDNFNGYYKISETTDFKKIIIDEQKSDDSHIYFVNTQ